MPWVILFVAGLFEVGWAIGLKYTARFTRFWPGIGAVAAMIVSVVLLGVAMKSLPVGTSYAVSVGVGAVGLNAGASLPAPASLDRYAWGQLCRGLFQIPIAA
jgi:multidrug transporter EmrE-like cation transporter